MPRWTVRFGVVLILVARPVPAAGQPRPLPMESVAGVGSGNVAFDVRVDYARDIHYPLSGLEGNLWRFALLRLDIGLSNIADLEVSGGLRDHLTIKRMKPAVLAGELQLSNPAA